MQVLISEGAARQAGACCRCNPQPMQGKMALKGILSHLERFNYFLFMQNLEGCFFALKKIINIVFNPAVSLPYMDCVFSHSSHLVQQQL